MMFECIDKIYPSVSIDTVTGSICNFTDNIGGLPLKSCTSLISGYQEGSGTPSPSNVRPLVGYTQADIVKCGKNLIDISEFARLYPSFCSYNDDVLSVISVAVLYNTGISVYIPSGAIINAKIVEGTATNIRIRLIFSDNTYADIPLLGFPYTTSKDIVSIRLNWTTIGTFEISEFQIELGSTATTYEPYNGNSYTFTFGQSIYQGYIDWKSGVVVAMWGYIDSYNGETLTGEWLCNKAPYEAETTPPTGSQVAYELATPIEIPLGGINLLTQQGVNNIFADCGDTTVEYINIT